MSDLIVPLPLDSAAREWLTSLGIECPDESGRWPTPGELRATLAGLPGRRVTFRDRPDGGWDADVEDAAPGGPGGAVTVWVEPPPNQEFNHPFSFEQAAPALAAVILEALARICGPQALYDPAANRVALVTPGADPVAVAERLAT